MYDLNIRGSVVLEQEGRRGSARVDSLSERSSRLTCGYIFLSSSAWQGKTCTRYGLLCGEKVW